MLYRLVFMLLLVRDLFLMNLNHLIFSCLWISYPCITLLICDECIFDYFMYVCVSIVRRLSVFFECFGVVVLYFQTCN